MDLLQAMRERHSVRAYDGRPVAEETVAALEQYIEELNRESGLHIQLVRNEPKAFDSFLAHYGKFSGVSSYFALVGKDNRELDELCGYYGEKLVLFAQTLGLNTCWVALTYKKFPMPSVWKRGKNSASSSLWVMERRRARCAPRRLRKR